MAAVLPAYGSDTPEEPILTVQGTVQQYTSSVYWMRDGATYHDEGIVASICTAPEGTEVYLRDLMPAWAEGWLKGESQDGELHFPSGQLVSKWGIGDIYMGATVKDHRTGNMNAVDEFVLTADTDGTYRLADRNGETVYIQAYLHDGTTLETDFGLVLTPFNCVEATPPADAEIMEYTRTYFDGVSKFPYSDVVTVARVDNNLWLEGFNGSSNGGFVAGSFTPEGDIFIPTGQYIGLSGSYAYFMFSGEKDSSTGDILDTAGLTLRKEGSGWASGQYGTLMFGVNRNQIEFRHNNFRLTPDESGVKDLPVAGADESVRTEYYDLTGRRLDGLCHGVCIAVRHYSDGRRVSVKETHIVK